jgi:RNA polymerase sigma-70 factor (ECF subfamily)
VTALSDGELVGRCRSGDDDAWRELVARFSRYVYAIATRAYGLGWAEAEEVFQEVFIRVFEHLDELRSDDAVRPWLAQIARRVAVDRVRSAGREEPRADPEPDRPSAEDAIAEIDEALTIHEALEHLPENCRELLDGFFARDQSYRMLSESLGLPQGTIASRISRCLGKLRDHLRKIEHPLFVS